MKLLLAYLSDRIELLALDIECSHGCRNQIRCSFKCAEIVYYVIQSDFTIQQRISENGNKNVTVKAYPNLNHLLQTCEKGTLAEYRQLEETISPEVLKDITDWILKHSGKSN